MRLATGPEKLPLPAKTKFLWPDSINLDSKKTNGVPCKSLIGGGGGGMGPWIEPMAAESEFGAVAKFTDPLSLIFVIKS